MIARARSNAAAKGLKPPQVAFVKALLTEPLPIESNSVDIVLSNCVINLLPLEGKALLFKEVTRILKPGGRVVQVDVHPLFSYLPELLGFTRRLDCREKKHSRVHEE